MALAKPRVDEQRRVDRVPVRLVTSNGRDGMPLTLLNLSTTGMLLNSPRALYIGDTVQVDLPKIGATGAKVMWHDADEYGCRFFSPIPESVVFEAERLSHRSRPRPVTVARKRQREEVEERGDDRALLYFVLFLSGVVGLFYLAEMMLLR